MSANITVIDVTIEPIELCKLLKIANMVGGGGEAKIVISEGYVLLNNDLEFQKRKKVYHNDIVEFNGETIQVNVINSITPAGSKVEKTTDKVEKVNAKSVKPNKRQNKISPPQADYTKNHEPVRSKRKPISF